MENKIYRISDYLSLKINAPIHTIEKIKKRFSLIESDNDTYDYEINYKDTELIEGIYDGSIKVPFRNSNYIVYNDSSRTVAYCPKQKYSCEHLIINNGSKIDTYVHDDRDSKVLIRLITEILIRKLLEKGFFPIHASCVDLDNEGILFLGKKNSGKSVSLFSYVFFDKANPVSNDITFVGIENGKWVCVGIPYDYTFDKSLFEQVNLKLDRFDLGKNFDSDKLRLSVNDFDEIFNTSWIWKSYLKEVNIVDLSKEEVFKIFNNISRDEAYNYLLNNGKDKNFNFDDYLNINNLYPEYRYDLLVNDYVFNRTTGNIIKYKSKGGR